MQQDRVCRSPIDQGCDDRGRVIGRRVVDHDHLHPHPRCTERTLDRSFDIARIVVQWYDHRHLGSEGRIPDRLRRNGGHEQRHGPPELRVLERDPRDHPCSHLVYLDNSRASRARDEAPGRSRGLRGQKFEQDCHGIFDREFLLDERETRVRDLALPRAVGKQTLEDPRDGGRTSGHEMSRRDQRPEIHRPRREHATAVRKHVVQLEPVDARAVQLVRREDDYAGTGKQRPALRDIELSGRSSDQVTRVIEPHLV